MTDARDARIAALLDRPITRTTRMSHGQVGPLVEVTDADGATYVAKFDDSGGDDLAIEARMLGDLAMIDDFPSPHVIGYADGCLVMTRLSNEGTRTPEADERAARALAALHDHGQSQYGYPYDTLIGGLPQPNTWHERWTDFLGAERLGAMGRQCLEAGRIDGAFLDALHALITRLDTLLPSPHAPGLIHGDVWGGNVVIDAQGHPAFIDPALSYSDPEIEIAFTTMFSTFGDRFYDAYDEIRPLSADFWEVRRPLYNLYPLLVHVRIYGGGYVSQARSVIDRFT